MAQTDKAKPAKKSDNRTSGKPNKVLAPAKPPVTKRDRLRARLERADGATLIQLEQEFGWQPHTVRAAISGLRKAGLEVLREPGETSSVYRIAAAKAA